MNNNTNKNDDDNDDDRTTVDSAIFSADSTASLSSPSSPSGGGASGQQMTTSFAATGAANKRSRGSLVGKFLALVGIGATTASAVSRSPSPEIGANRGKNNYAGANNDEKKRRRKSDGVVPPSIASTSTVAFRLPAIETSRLAAHQRKPKQSTAATAANGTSITAKLVTNVKNSCDGAGAVTRIRVPSPVSPSALTSSDVGRWRHHHAEGYLISSPPPHITITNTSCENEVATTKSDGSVDDMQRRQHPDTVDQRRQGRQQPHDIGGPTWRRQNEEAVAASTGACGEKRGGDAWYYCGSWEFLMCLNLER